MKYLSRNNIVVVQDKFEIKIFTLIQSQLQHVTSLTNIDDLVDICESDGKFICFVRNKSIEIRQTETYEILYK